MPPVVRLLSKRIMYLVILLTLVSKTLATDVENMRVRDLRRFLIKFGYEELELSRILDRKELKKLALEALKHKKAEEDAIYFNKVAFRWTVALLIISVLYLLKDLLKDVFKWLQSSYAALIFGVKSKLRLIRLGIENALFIASVSLILSLIIDIIQPLMQLSVMASWILPSNSALRRFLFPWPNLSVTLESVLNMAGGSNTAKPKAPVTQAFGGKFGNIGNMGINLGPMVTIWAFNWMKHSLENFGASRLISIVEERQRKRQEKKKQQQSSMPSEDDPVCDFTYTGGDVKSGDNTARGGARRNFTLPTDNDRSDSTAEEFAAANNVADDGDFWASTSSDGDGENDKTSTIVQNDSESYPKVNSTNVVGNNVNSSSTFNPNDID